VSTNSKTTTPAVALAAAVATRDERAAAVDEARAAVERIVSEWRAGIDTSSAAEKRSAEDEVERLTLLHAAAERDVERARKALPTPTSVSRSARDLIGTVTRAVAEATSYTYTGPLGPMDNGRRFGLATSTEDVQTSERTDASGQRQVTVTATFVGYPTLRRGQWNLSDVDPQVATAVAAQVGTEVPGLGVVQSADVLGASVIENGGTARDRDDVHVVGGRSDKSMVDAVAVRVRFVASSAPEPESGDDAPGSKPTRRGVDPRERKVAHPGEVSK
jgi:hypothetical protein